METQLLLPLLLHPTLFTFEDCDRQTYFQNNKHAHSRENDQMITLLFDPCRLNGNSEFETLKKKAPLLASIQMPGSDLFNFHLTL